MKGTKEEFEFGRTVCSLESIESIEAGERFGLGTMTEVVGNERTVVAVCATFGEAGQERLAARPVGKEKRCVRVEEEEEEEGEGGGEGRSWHRRVAARARLRLGVTAPRTSRVASGSVIGRAVEDT